jgi:ABC-type transport system substrate-binding protein
MGRAKSEREVDEMMRYLRALAVAAVLGAVALESASAQKQVGILRVYHWDSPASMSIHEEATYSTVVPMMGVFNNLIMYKQDEPKNIMQSIVTDLATRWSWSEHGMHLTFTLREDVKWHDGKPLRLRTSSAPGTCSSADRTRSCAPIPGHPGTITWTMSLPMPHTRRPFI